MEAAEVGANQQQQWSRNPNGQAERRLRDLKQQVGSSDPGMEALEGAIVAGERKAVAKNQSQTGDALRRTGRH